MLQPPEHILRRIAGIGKFKGIEFGKTGSPKTTVVTLWVACDRIRIAIEDEVDLVQLPGSIQNLLKMVQPADTRPHRDSGRVGIGWQRRRWPGDRSPAKSGTG